MVKALLPNHLQRGQVTVRVTNQEAREWLLYPILVGKSGTTRALLFLLLQVRYLMGLIFIKIIS